MNLLLTLGISLLVGGALGWLHFRMLWLIVRRLPQRPHPGLRFALALVARLALVLGGLAIVLRWADWPALVAALAGFLVSRAVLAQRVRKQDGSGS